MAFVETRLNTTEVVYDTVGGAGYSTEIVTVRSGYEARNSNWAQSRGRWEIGERLLKRTELDLIVAFFNSMRGRAHGFRFKDWADYQATVANGILGSGIGAGVPTYQLVKRYSVGGQNTDKQIKKPVSGTVQAFRNAVAIAGLVVDTVTGIVTVPALSSATITGITKANPGVVTTSAAHGFSNGDLIYITGVNGMTQVNNLVFTIAGVTSTTFQLGVNTTSYGTYTSGGTASKYHQPADVLTWSGEFDVPVRFDADEIRTQFRAMEGSESLHFLSSLPVIEIRI